MTTFIKEDLNSLREKLLSIETEFSKKITEIEEKTKDFINIDRKLDESLKTKDVQVRIDVGGKLFITKFSVLLSVKDTLFYILLADYQSKNKETPKEFFFDRNYTHFPLVLEYLRHKIVCLKNYSKIEKEDIMEEFEFFGIDLFSRGKKHAEIDIEWDQGLSKAGTCTVNSEDGRSLTVNSTTCYTHFVTNKLFNSENFVIELESTVTQTDNYYYIGIYNQNYNLSSNCGCCNPANAYYIQCDGSVHINGVRTENTGFAWNSSPCIIGLRVLLNENQIYFYKDSPVNEIGPFNIASGNDFRVYAGHCNTGNGKLNIQTCYSI